VGGPRFKNEVELLKRGWVRAQTVNSKTSSPIFYDVFEKLEKQYHEA